MVEHVTPSAEELLEAWRVGRLGELVENGLAPLLNAPFRYIGRATDLVWLGFGPDVSVRDLKGEERTVARFALHLQCPFRLDGAAGALIAAQDVYHSPSTPWNDPEDFDPDVLGSTLFDAKATDLSADQASVKVVQRIRADASGGFELDIEELTLRVFPATSFQREHWRFFESSSEDRHMVLLQEPGPA